MNLFLILLSMNLMKLISTDPIIDCDKYKYKVRHQFQPGFCMGCQICPANVDSKVHNEACKKKVPDSIPGQGYAWCTGTNDRSPWCPHLTVHHGTLDCNKGFSVYSNCSLKCDFGYMPGNSTWTELRCLESLNWNIFDQSVLTCIRTAKPDKPFVSSPGQRQEVKSNSEKTLQCTNTSDTVGKPKTYWYFKGEKLYSDSDLNIYVIHETTKDNEGEYFCQVEDDIGKSELSAGYYLKVEVTDTSQSDTKYFHGIQADILLGILATVLSMAMLFGLCYKRSAITNRCHHKGSDTIDSCLSSVASSVGGSSQSSGTSSTSDSKSNDEESTSPLIIKADKLLHFSQLTTESDNLQHSNTKCVLTLEKEISCSQDRASLYPLTSALKSPGTNTLPVSAARHDGTTEHDPTGGINNKDQDYLRLVFKDCKLMKRIITLLDQKAEINRDKPTFHSLGRYLGDSPDEISHFEFTCQHKELSPTERYMKRMIEEGQGISNLLIFLKKHRQTQELAQDIQKHILHLYHTSVD